MIRSAKDFWAGSIYIAVGMSAIVIARDYPMGTAFKMGPAYFPTILGGLLAVVGAVSVIRAFFLAGDAIGNFTISGLAWVSAAIFVFGFLARRAGLALALPLLVVISARASAQFRWGPILALAAGLTIFCVLVFVKGLGIPLPIVGPWFAD